jgi:hypothetical protein
MVTIFNSLIGLYRGIHQHLRNSLNRHELRSPNHLDNHKRTSNLTKTVEKTSRAI